MVPQSSPVVWWAKSANEVPFKSYNFFENFVDDPLPFILDCIIGNNNTNDSNNNNDGNNNQNGCNDNKNNDNYDSYN